LERLNCTDREVSVLFVDDEGITAINREYLNRDRPTNVIAFPMTEGEFGDINPHVLGDIVISVDTALRDARSGGLTLYDEIVYLLIHGLLHLIGYDHEGSEEDAAVMKEREHDLFHAVTGYGVE